MVEASQCSWVPGPNLPCSRPVPIEIVLNGKFLSQRVTGVQRYGRQILQAFDTLLAEPAFRPAVSMQLLVPPDAVDIPELRNIRVCKTGRLHSHLWEQLWLPLKCSGKPLLSLSGSAPWFKCRQYATIHDAVLYEFPQAYSLTFRLWYRALFARLSRICPLLFTVSMFSRDRLAHFLPAASERLVVAYNGHEHFGAISPELEILSHLNLAPKGFFLVVGSLNPNKNLLRLARVVAHQLAGTPTQFVVVGNSNPAVFSLDSAAELPVNFIRAGYLNDGELKALYMHARALVFPSLYEGFGIPLLEAMSVGCPILASNAASIPEVCGPYASYFDPESEADIARCLQAAIEAPDTMSASRMDSAADRLDVFSWRRSAAVILESIVRAEQTASSAPKNAS